MDPQAPNLPNTKCSELIQDLNDVNWKAVFHLDEVYEDFDWYINKIPAYQVVKLGWSMSFWSPSGSITIILAYFPPSYLLCLTLQLTLNYGQSLFLNR